MISEQLEKFEINAPNPFFSARITRPDYRQRDLSGVPDNIEKEQLYLFSAECSNQHLDSFYTKMAGSSLTNYAEDAKTGVAFLDSHQHHNRIGYSFDGVLLDGAVARVLADFYTVRGLKLGNLSTDDFIAGTDFGLIRDVSIGFKEGDGFQYTCSICTRDLFDWDCEHIPSMKYEVVTNPDAEPDAQIKEERTAFAWIENARLSEVSAVFDGATPDAMIVKATREHRAGRLKGNQLDSFEQRSRIHLPRSEKFRGFELNPELGENDMGVKDEETSGAPDKMLAREVAFEANSCGVKVEEATHILDMAKAMRSEIERLKPYEIQAVEGRQLREALVEETLEEGIRALGDTFDKATRKEMLDGLPIATIQEMRSSWKEMGDVKFSHGRQSADDPDGDPDENDDDADDDSIEAVDDDSYAAVGGV